MKLFQPAQSVSPAVLDVTLLVARAALGVILFAHGWQKFMQYTLAGTTAAFADMGVPVAPVAAAVVATAEIAGGLLLVLGALTRVAAAVNVATLVGALALVHACSSRTTASNWYSAWRPGSCFWPCSAGVVTLSTPSWRAAADR